MPTMSIAAPTREVQQHLLRRHAGDRSDDEEGTATAIDTLLAMRIVSRSITAA